MTDADRKPTTKVGFMCKVDFDHELGEALGGIQVYSSIEDCQANRTCVDECGIVEVEVRLVRVVEQGTI